MSHRLETLRVQRTVVWLLVDNQQSCNLENRRSRGAAHFPLILTAFAGGFEDLVSATRFFRRSFFSFVTLALVRKGARTPLRETGAGETWGGEVFGKSFWQLLVSQKKPWFLLTTSVDV